MAGIVRIRIRSSSVLLWIWQWTYTLHKKREISSVTMFLLRSNLHGDSRNSRIHNTLSACGHKTNQTTATFLRLPEITESELKLPIQPHPALESRMVGSMSLLPVHAFMACTGTPLSLTSLSLMFPVLRIEMPHLCCTKQSLLDLLCLHPYGPI